jgi:hypothetical protein
VPFAPHRHDTTVTATHPATHDPLNRDLTRSTEAQRGFGHCREHAFRSTRINHDRRIRRSACQLPFERCDDPSALAGASVLGGEHERDPHRAEHVEVKELRGLPCAVKQGRCDTARGQRVTQLGKRCEPDSAGDHPGFGRRIDERERTSERTEARDRIALPGCVDQSGRYADALVEKRNSDRSPRAVSQNFEDRERAPEERIVTGHRLHHHELTGPSGRGDFRCGER